MIRVSWTEKYRPKNMSEYVFRDKKFKNKIQEWISEKHLPMSLLLTGSPGTGKTSAAKMLLNEMNIDEFDILEINASRNNSVDEVRDNITNFVQLTPFGDTGFRVVLLDECLDENTIVSVLRHGIEQFIKIKDLDDVDDLVKSYNIELNRVEWKPFELFYKGEREVLEITFENDSVIICTPEHKWYVMDNDEIKVVQAIELENYNHILSPMKL